MDMDMDMDMDADNTQVYVVHRYMPACSPVSE